MRWVHERRARAAQACIDRFMGRPYDPAARRDCAWMARHNLHHLGLRIRQGKLPSYRTEAEGLRALVSAGWSSLADAVDSLGLPRIAPASALPADIIALPTDHPLGALAIPVGNGRVLAYLDGESDAVLFDPTDFVCAWRTL